MKTKILILITLLVLLVPDCAWSLSARIGTAEDEVIFIKEILSGFTVVKDAPSTGPDARESVVADILAGIGEQGIIPALLWRKFNYVHSKHSDDILMVPMQPSGDRQRYVLVCEPAQEKLILGSESKVIKKIPVWKGFRAKDYHKDIKDRNILIVEEPRLRFYYGTLRGTIVEMSRKGYMGRTLVADYEYAVDFTNVTARTNMRMITRQERNAFRPVGEVQRVLNRKRLLLPENHGVGFGVVLEYWADLIEPVFANETYQPLSINIPKNQRAVSLNCLTEKSKQDFVYLSGLTQKQKWMDESWDNVKFPDHALTSDEIVEVMAERGTELFDLNGRELTAVYRIEKSA